MFGDDIVVGVMCFYWLVFKVFWECCVFVVVVVNGVVVGGGFSFVMVGDIIVVVCLVSFI